MLDDVSPTATTSSLLRAAIAVGARIREVREAKGLTQEEVALSAGIAVYTYGKLERGESNPGTCANPRLQTLIRIAHALEVDLQDLLSEGGGIPQRIRS